MKKLLTIAIILLSFCLMSCNDVVNGIDGMDGADGMDAGSEINTQIECCTFPDWLIGNWIPLIGGSGYTFSGGVIICPYATPTGNPCEASDYDYSHEEISANRYYLKLNLDDAYLTGWSITVYKSDPWIIINDLFYVKGE